MQDYVAVTKVEEGDTILVSLYPSYPVYPHTAKNGTTQWLITSGRQRKKSWSSSMFGGTVTSNDTTNGILYINGSPSSLEGYHMYLKPGAGCIDRDGHGYRNGVLELPYVYIRRAFIIVPHPTHPGERPTALEQKHPPHFFKYVRLDRRY